MLVVLEGKKILTREQLHDALSLALALPGTYGKNLDALWDCMTGWIEPPVTIVWRDYISSKAALGEYAERAAMLLHEATSEVEGLQFRVE